MSVSIPDTHIDLVEQPLVVTLATVMPDGQPQTTLIWFEFDGDIVRFTTSRDAQKEKIMGQDPRVSLLARDPDNPYRYLEIRGTVESIDEAGAIDQLNRLAQRYTDHPTYYERKVKRSTSSAKSSRPGWRRLGKKGQIKIEPGGTHSQSWSLSSGDGASSSGSSRS